MTEDTLKRICNVFIGDEENYYQYKSGAKLVNFFNSNFGCNEKYGQGFPSRWIYVYNKLVEKLNSNSINDFFSLILSNSYMMLEHDCNQVEASEWVNKSITYFNKILGKESYSLVKKGKDILLIQENTDLILIGSGGFADVYYQKSTGYVVKKLKEDFWSDKGIRSRFHREFKITKELGDVQGIIQVYEFDNSSMSYSMKKAEITFDKYVIGNTLDEKIKINCIRIILSIMKTVHERDIIHRDLSPNNIFIFNGQIKIADFGLGKDLNMFTSHQTIHTNAVGQYYYCAPEQFMLLRDGDKRSDVYSLGRIINFIMTEDPTNSHHIFRSVAEKATNSDAAYRYGDTSQLLAAFEKSVMYNNAINRSELINGRIRNGIFDDDVEAYIYELTGHDICSKIFASNSQFTKALIKFMKKSEDQGNHIVQLIDSVFREECKTYESYDPIASFTYAVLQEHFCFTINETAASILRYIAFDVNRFSAQRLVEVIINQGVEPLIEDILKG